MATPSRWISYDQANTSASFSPVNDDDELICIWKDRWLPTRDYGEGTALAGDTPLADSFTDPDTGCADGISIAPPSGRVTLPRQWRHWWRR